METNDAHTLNKWNFGGLTRPGMGSADWTRGGPVWVGVAEPPPLPASSPPPCAKVTRSSLLSTRGAAMMASVIDLLGEVEGGSGGGSARPPRARSARSAFSPSPHMA